MGLFDVFSGGSPDLESEQRDAFARERQRLKLRERQARQEADFLSTEGEGISETADFKFGDETDLEDLTPEEQEARSTGRILNTGLIL